MRSSQNTYIANLDHLRAFAAFQVFVFHFVHHSTRCGLALCHVNIYTPLAGFSLLEQGGAGVSMFMCLSGYIFACLTDGRQIQPIIFIYNRLLRLMPLLLFLAVMVHLFYNHPPPNGTWSIYIEMEYYAVLPVVLVYVRGYGGKVLLILALCMLLLRAEEWFRASGSAMEISYYTLVGRADQLLIGGFAFYVESWIKKNAFDPRRLFRICGFLGLAGLIIQYHYFCLDGGLYQYPVTGFYWVIAPFLDAVFYSLVIICYLQFKIGTKASAILCSLGRWSYSIYLEQFYFIPLFYSLMSRYVPAVDNFYGRLLIASLAAFPLAFFISALSYRLIEKPFLRFRKNYFIMSHINTVPVP